MLLKIYSQADNALRLRAKGMLLLRQAELQQAHTLNGPNDDKNVVGSKVAPLIAPVIVPKIFAANSTIATTRTIIAGNI